MITNPLLRRYVTERSEPAFAELVGQHIDLVYSAALRQVNGDVAAAQDVAQAVFTDLARKAPRLLRHSSLTGWLYTSTRYQAAKARRSDQRRIAREQEAYAMNQLLQSTDSDPAWHALRPVLDEAMHELSADDQEAVLLRYFEHQPLVEIGTRLGLTEDAARKRVARALDKLRTRLARRGITSTVAALSLALAERTVSAAPAGMAGQVSQSAVAAVAGGGSSTATLWKLLAGTGVAGMLAVLFVAPKFLHQMGQAASSAPTIATLRPATNSSPVSASALTFSQALDTTNKLILRIVAADSGQPIPSVNLDCWLWTATSCKEKPLAASPLGVCEVPVPRAKVTELDLISKRDGFADTRLRWHVDRGEIIPQNYTLRLARATFIGGTVVDADGSPVAGAEIGFDNYVDPSAEVAIETANFGWGSWITATSDVHGHWQINRLAYARLRTLSGGASHPLYVRSLFESGNSSIEKLLAGTYEFRLGRGMEVRGSVVDAAGRPVTKAKVTVGQVSDVNSRETTTDAKGQFHASGCAPANTSLSAEASGFAVTTLSVDLRTNTGPFQVTLLSGKLLRLRVVNTEGLPVPKAQVSLNLFNSDFPAAQTDFTRLTGVDGRLEWTNAPDQELQFDFSAHGYMGIRGEKVSPDGQEHLITLAPALTISGTVRDAATGAPIPSFRLIAATGAIEGRWIPIERLWLNFHGGKFRHVYAEPADHGYIFKFEADGYAPYLTRPVALNEGDVQLDVALQSTALSTVTVTLPDGRPAANVDVGIVSPDAGLRLVPGGFSHRRSELGGSLLLTDGQGRFPLTPDVSVTSVIAAGPEGYAEATISALTASPVMVLQPWGRLEGTLLMQGHPGAECALAFQWEMPSASGIRADTAAYQVKTDSAGHFVFPQVPPGKHVLAQAIELSPTERARLPLTNVDIVSGETTTVTVNGKQRH
ncbi:MAG TPA: sigma-70 family RNA polymerase sigma factor [Candidatus Saccharimonadales bacterium]|nr:sigma-70 family RNA polymerase sigma factor [Candidatus Saccharimonadales bacterium]